MKSAMYAILGGTAAMAVGLGLAHGFEVVLHWIGPHLPESMWLVPVLWFASVPLTAVIGGTGLGIVAGAFFVFVGSVLAVAEAAQGVVRWARRGED